jgi:hypothetical protein
MKPLVKSMLSKCSLYSDTKFLNKIEKSNRSDKFF